MILFLNVMAKVRQHVFHYLRVMCYTIQQLEERIIKQGQRKNAVPDEIEEALRIFREQIKGKPLFAVSGFDHPALPILLSDDGLAWYSMQWGLIPHWCRSWTTALELMNMTLNARAETIFEKPAFVHAAKTRRGLLPITGFYEYKHVKGKKYPHFVDWSDEEVRWLACICDEWRETERGDAVSTFAIVTTQANSFMANIHNNPELEGPRMPVVLYGSELLLWMDHQTSEQQITELLKPREDKNLRAHTVKPLRGKNATGNSSEAFEKFVYSELLEQPRLF
jgi:putative SOS response-associated peptidase YedK